MSWLFHAFSQRSMMAVICCRSAWMPEEDVWSVGWSVGAEAIDKRPATTNASVRLVATNMRVISTPVASRRRLLYRPGRRSRTSWRPVDEGRRYRYHVHQVNAPPLTILPGCDGSL